MKMEEKEEITKQEFEVLFNIEFMNITDPKTISSRLEISEKEAENILKKLEQKGLIKIEYRENKACSSQLTSKGSEVYENDKYLNWKLELGY